MEDKSWFNKVYPIGASNVGDPTAGGASNRYLGTRLPMDVAEYQMPLLREIEIRLKKKCDKLADAFIDSDLGEGTVVNASPCGNLVNVVIPRPNPNGEPVTGVGKVCLEYDNTDGSTRAHQGLNGRRFGGNQVVASFYLEDKFSEGVYDG
ncbi:splicing factor U2af large subunit B isoform X3 [Tanacetum coccineum]